MICKITFGFYNLFYSSCFSGDFGDVRIFVGWRPTKAMQLQGCGMILTLCFSTQRLVIYCFFAWDINFSLSFAFSCIVSSLLMHLLFAPNSQYNEGTLLDGYKRNCTSQHWWAYNPCEHWYRCNYSGGTSLRLVYHLLTLNMLML